MAMPRNYADPMFAALARAAEESRGLPKGILDAIRMQGERSNSDQVSSAGARTPYQVIPATRRGVIKNYGVDPWQSAESATDAAALLLKEGYGRTHSWDKAIAGYHGGIAAENGQRGPVNRAYTARVGSFDTPAGEEQPVYDNYYNRDPLAPLPDMPLTSIPERPKETAPVLNDAGPSVPVEATSPAATRKRRGLLGSIGHALGSVFMPKADSLYAAALRGGIWDAHAEQDRYKAAQAAAATNTEAANFKLKQMMTKGQYAIAGNNIVHYPPDGGEPTIIAPPQTKTEKERLIDAWRAETDPGVRDLMERMLLGANSDPVLENRSEVARTRAGATTSSARIRANAPSKSGTARAKGPPAGFVLD